MFAMIRADAGFIKRPQKATSEAEDVVVTSSLSWEQVSRDDDVSSLHARTLGTGWLDFALGGPSLVGKDSHRAKHDDEYP